MNEEKETFEQRLERLDAAAAALESGKLPLEEAVGQFERSIKETEQLEKELADMTRRITEIRAGANGNPEEVPWKGN